MCARNARAHRFPDTHPHDADILAYDSTNRLLSDIQPTHVLHLAWESTPGSTWASPANLLWVASTLNLVRAAASHGCIRFVGVGTCAEYDWTSGGVFCEQQSRIAPATLYGASKASTGLVLQAFCSQIGMSFSWARVFYEYGPYEHPARVVPSIIRSVLAGNPAECTHGEQLRDFLCSVDVGEALAALLNSNIEGPINIGSGRPIRIKELATLAAELAGDASLLRLGSKSLETPEALVVLPKLSRLQHELGWSPRFSLRDGMACTVNYWRREFSLVGNRDYCP